MVRITGIGGDGTPLVFIKTGVLIKGVQVNEEGLESLCLANGGGANGHIRVSSLIGFRVGELVNLGGWQGHEVGQGEDVILHKCSLYMVFGFLEP